MNRPGHLGSEFWALGDFRDNVYYSTRAFLEAHNPYDREIYLATYPVRVRFPPYTPLYLLAHTPLALLRHTPAQLVYYALTLVLTLVLAITTLRMCGTQSTCESVCWLGSLILLTRPGHWNLVLGQTTLEFVLAVYAAFHFGKRSPWLAGVAIAMTTMKPTIGFPLVLLLLCLGYRRSVTTGLFFAVMATLIPTVILINSAGGAVALAESYIDTVSVFEEDQPANPVLSASRLDAPALFSALVGRPLSLPARAFIFAAVFSLACVGIRRLCRLCVRQEGETLSFTIAILAMLIALYQQLYNALLLVLPLTALVTGRLAPNGLFRNRTTEWLLAGLMALPLFNHLVAFRVVKATEVIPWLWSLTVSLNRVALIAAFLIVIGSTLRYSRVTGNSDGETA